MVVLTIPQYLSVYRTAWFLHLLEKSGFLVLNENIRYFSKSNGKPTDLQNSGNSFNSFTDKSYIHCSFMLRNTAIKTTCKHFYRLHQSFDVNMQILMLYMQNRRKPQFSVLKGCQLFNIMKKRDRHGLLRSLQLS